MRITRRVNGPGLPGVEDSSALVPLPRPTTDDTRGRDPDPTAADRVELSDGARLRRDRMREAAVPFAALAAADPALAAVADEMRREAARVRRAQRINEGIIRSALAHVT